MSIRKGKLGWATAGKNGPADLGPASDQGLVLRRWSNARPGSGRVHRLGLRRAMPTRSGTSRSSRPPGCRCMPAVSLQPRASLDLPIVPAGCVCFSTPTSTREPSTRCLTRCRPDSTTTSAAYANWPIRRPRIHPPGRGWRPRPNQLRAGRTRCRRRPAPDLPSRLKASRCDRQNCRQQVRKGSAHEPTGLMLIHAPRQRSARCRDQPTGLTRLNEPAGRCLCARRRCLAPAHLYRGMPMRLPSGRHGIDDLSIRPSAPRPRSKKIPNG